MIPCLLFLLLFQEKVYFAHDKEITPPRILRKVIALVNEKPIPGASATVEAVFAKDKSIKRMKIRRLVGVSGEDAELEVYRALRKWIFQPGESLGQPINVKMIVRVSFETYEEKRINFEETITPHGHYWNEILDNTNQPAQNANEELINNIKNGNTTAALELLETRANPNAEDPYGFRIRNINDEIEWVHKGRTALMTAIWVRETSMVLPLLRRGADVNLYDNAGYTALMVAALKGDLEITQTLLNHKAVPNEYLENGKTVLHFAIDGGNPNVMTALFEAGANLNLDNSLYNRLKTYIDQSTHSPLKRDQLLNVLKKQKEKE